MLRTDLQKVTGCISVNQPYTNKQMGKGHSYYTGSQETAEHSQKQSFMASFRVFTALLYNPPTCQ